MNAIRLGSGNFFAVKTFFSTPDLNDNWTLTYDFFLHKEQPKMWDLWGSCFTATCLLTIGQYSNMTARLSGKTNFSRFSCLSIPKRDLDTKKRTPKFNIEV